MRIDFDATISIAHSEKQNAVATWKKSFGPFLAFLDWPQVAGGEALAGLLRAGNAGSKTGADHVKVLDMGLAAAPADARLRPGDPASPRVLGRSDSAGATPPTPRPAANVASSSPSGSPSMSATRLS